MLFWHQAPFSFWPLSRRLKKTRKAWKAPHPPCLQGPLCKSSSRLSTGTHYINTLSVFGLLSFSMQALSNTDPSICLTLPQVLPYLPPLPEAKQHIRPVPLYLPTHPSTTHQVSARWSRMGVIWWAPRSFSPGRPQHAPNTVTSGSWLTQLV